MNARNIFAIAACAAAVLVQASAAGAATGGVAPATAAVPTAPAAAAPVGAAAAASESSAHPLDRAELESWLDGMVPYALKAGDMAGAVVVVVKDGTVLLQKGYGYADVSKKLR
ncbi:MAG TPA: hypothetical protein VN891_14940, partial [Steroidobacteraceae bacterium]|nr:hypothetical protein [Steroidobacteraceae bacterium]